VSSTVEAPSPAVRIAERGRTTFRVPRPAAMAAGLAIVAAALALPLIDDAPRVRVVTEGAGRRASFGRRGGAA
jgi:hypothetical protein